MSPRIFQPGPSPSVTSASRAFQPPRPFASPAPESAGAQGAGTRGHDFARISVHAPGAGAAGGVLQLARNKKLSPKAEENRARLLAKRARRYERELRIRQAEQGFHAMFQKADGKPLVGADREQQGISAHHFPLWGDNDRIDPNRPNGDEDAHEDEQKWDEGDEKEPEDPKKQEKNEPKKKTMAAVLARLPVKLRKSEGFRRVLALPDSAHNQQGPRTEVERGELQAALAAFQYAREKGLKTETIQSAGEQIDYRAQDAAGHDVLFDPFLSPSAAEGREAENRDKNRWAAKDKDYATYYNHTHSKGGDPRTVGVWDKTYTTAADERDLKQKLEDSGATDGANVHELRVPLPRMYAEEHVAAEDEIERSKKASAAKAAFHASVAKRYSRAQRGKAPEKRVSLEEALIETGRGGEPTQRARYWQAELAKYRS